MITWKQLKEKFFDKGYDWEFDLFIGNIPNPDFSRLLISPGESQEDVIKRFYKIWEEHSQKEWDYWNTWIDYQKHK